MHGGYELLKDGGEHASPTRKGHRRAVLGVLIAAAILLSTFYAFGPKLHLLDDANCPASASFAADRPEASQEPLKQCAASVPQPAKAPAPVNLWSSLTVNDTATIAKWLNDPAHGLNLTSAETASLSDNTVFHIEAHRPAKVDALQYLQSPSEDTLPPRYARVTLDFGGLSTDEGGPVIRDYLVGPLPISGNTTMRELKDIYHRDDIPWNARGFSIPTELTPLLVSYMPRLAEATKVCRPHLPL